MRPFATLTAAALLGATTLAGPAGAASHTGDNPMVGGAPMMADRTIVENAADSPIHTTLVAAVTEAGLVDTLSGDGPFTVFAPTDAAFAALPEGTVETLLEPQNKAELTRILTAHVVPGRLTAETITAGIGSDGLYNMTTVSGDALSARIADGVVTIHDESGHAYPVTIADVMQSNGVIHVVEGVLLPQ